MPKKSSCLLVSLDFAFSSSKYTSSFTGQKTDSPQFYSLKPWSQSSLTSSCIFMFPKSYRTKNDNFQIDKKTSRPVLFRTRCFFHIQYITLIKVKIPLIPTKHDKPQPRLAKSGRRQPRKVQYTLSAGSNKTATCFGKV